MIKFLFFFLITVFQYNTSFARNIGETEITTEDGIEVYQEEKYYLLKKNVEILSDELVLYGQNVKIFFEKDLYDITELIAKIRVTFDSKLYNVNGKGNYLKFNVIKENIFIDGVKSELYLENTKMFSDGNINVNNLDGTFFIKGKNSRLISEDIDITGNKIDGNFEIIDGVRDIENLFVFDDKKLIIKTDDIIMNSKRAIYNKQKSIIELFENVTIKRGSEIITGDYGILDTIKKSYKVSSNNSKKVKAIISESNE